MHVRTSGLRVLAAAVVIGAQAAAWGQYGEELPPSSMAPKAVAQAPAGGWGATLGLAFNSKYVSRGLLTTNGPVLQPSATVSHRGLSLTAWNNTNLTSTRGAIKGGSENDYTVAYAWKARGLNLSAGTIYYQYIHAEKISTLEVFGSVGLDGALSPKLEVYQDVHENYGAYVTGSVSHHFKEAWKPGHGVAMGVALTAQVAWATAGQNRHNLGVSRTGLADILLSAGTPFHFGRHLVVTPAANFSWLMDDEIRAGVAHPSVFWYGVTTTYTF